MLKNVRQTKEHGDFVEVFSDKETVQRIVHLLKDSTPVETFSEYNSDGYDITQKVYTRNGFKYTITWVCFEALYVKLESYNVK
jgi:hypothetical protein